MADLLLRAAILGGGGCNAASSHSCCPFMQGSCVGIPGPATRVQSLKQINGHKKKKLTCSWVQ